MDFNLFILLLAGHYLADFGLQSRFVADKKAFIFIEPIGVHALTAHAFIHGLVAYGVSSSMQAAIIIGITHWLIDFVRSSIWLHKKFAGKREWISIHGDQALHIAVIVLITVIVS